MTASRQKQATFLAAIRDNPDDDAPRLRFADWLEEQGDPRGELIRIQCALARMKKTDPGRKKLRQREKELLREHGKEWKGRPPRDRCKVRFQRGLLAVTVDADVLLEDQASRWWTDRQNWVSLLDLEWVDDENWRKLMARGLLTQVFSLALCDVRVREAGLKRLAKLSQLRTLDLSGSDERVTDAVLKRLAALRHLTKLNLMFAGVTDVGLKHLAGLTQLRTLDVNCCYKVKGPGLAHLARLPQLQALNLSWTKVTDVALKHLAALTQLTELDLNFTAVTDRGLKHLAGLTQLRTLNLYLAKVTDEGLEHLARLTQLQTLDLRETKVTDAGLEYLARFTQLEKVYLHGLSAVTRAGKRKLRKALPGCKLSSSEY